MENCLSIFILDSNEASGEILKKYIEEISSTSKVSMFREFSQALEVMKCSEEKFAVFVDISNESAFEYLQEIKTYTSKIVITSINYSTDLLIKALRVGAKEFLPKPVIKKDLERVLALLESDEDIKFENSSQIISIYSNKGGIGKTTIATNLAVELAKTSGAKVALLDLNLQLGDVSTFLNINPAFDVAYVIKKLIDKKEEIILSSFEKYRDLNLYILSDPNYIEESESITPYQINKLFNVLKEVFQYIIIDMSSSIDANSLQILDKSDLILFTSIVNLPAIRNCQRCMTLFNSRNYPKEKVKIILNRYMENEEIKLEDIETALNEKIYWKIPNNYFSIMEAINRGVPVSDINSSSNISNSFKELAIKISDDIVKKIISNSYIN